MSALSRGSSHLLLIPSWKIGEQLGRFTARPLYKIYSFDRCLMDNINVSRRLETTPGDQFGALLIGDGLRSKSRDQQSIGDLPSALTIACCRP